MSKKSLSGLLGIIVGGIWLAMNFKHYGEQGFVAIGMPLIILILGIIYFIRGRNE
jgi:hypothetical protein